MKALQVISRERCAFLSGTPTMITAILRHPDLNTFDLFALKLIGTGGAPVPVALMEQVKERLGADVFIGFGQTEATCRMSAHLPGEPEGKNEWTQWALRFHCSTEGAGSRYGMLGASFS